MLNFIKELNKAPQTSVLWRSCGIFPLLFFSMRFWEAKESSEFQVIFWICHFNNLLLALAFLLHLPALGRISSLWLALTIFIWLTDINSQSNLSTGTIMTHIGGFVFGLLYLYKFIMVKHTWIACVIYQFLAQFLCYLFTNPIHNVNCSHRVWENSTQQNYWIFWGTTVVKVCIGLFIIENIFLYIKKRGTA